MSAFESLHSSLVAWCVGCGKTVCNLSGLGTAGPESRRVRLHVECTSSGDLLTTLHSGHMTGS